MNQNQFDIGSDYQEVPFLADIGLVTTYHCQAACLHCIVEASPKREEYIPLSEAHSWLEQISSYNNSQIKALALTGGEPFSNLEHLTSIVEKASSLGLIISSVSNAYWAISYEAALNILKNLPAIGLLTFSTDMYHQKVIPLERVKNAFTAAQTLGRRCNIAVCSGNVLNDVTKKTIDYLSTFASSEAINIAHIYPVGRARRLVEITQYDSESTPPVIACNMAHAPVILPNGDIIACFGPIIGIKSDHPLFLGNLYKETLSDILKRAEINPILHAIRIWGPHKLINMIKDESLGDCLPEKYVKDSICCTCFDLMKDLPQKEKLKDFYDKLMRNKEFLEIVAYGRAFYLQENNMMELLNYSYSTLKE